MDQTGARDVSDALSANQGGDLLARTVAEPGSDLQQLAGEFVRRSAGSVSGRCGETGLGRALGVAAHRTEKVSTFSVAASLGSARASRAGDGALAIANFSGKM